MARAIRGSGVAKPKAMRGEESDLGVGRFDDPLETVFDGGQDLRAVAGDALLQQDE